MCIQPARRNLYALHAGGVPQRIWAFGEVARRKIELLNFVTVVALTIVVALAVGAAAQARLGEEPLFQLALLTEHEFGLEYVHLALQMLRHLPIEFFFPQRIRSFHDDPQVLAPSL